MVLEKPSYFAKNSGKTLFSERGGMDITRIGELGEVGEAKKGLVP